MSGVRPFTIRILPQASRVVVLYEANVFAKWDGWLDAESSVAQQTVGEAKNFNVAARHPPLNIAQCDYIGFWRPLRMFGSRPKSADDFLQ